MYRNQIKHLDLCDPDENATRKNVKYSESQPYLVITARSVLSDPLNNRTNSLESLGMTGQYIALLR